VHAFLRDVASLFLRAAAEGQLAPGDPVERTLAFWATVHGALCLEKARRIAPELPAPIVIGTAATRALLAGWGASPAAIARAAKVVERASDARREGEP
jgi:hypothetical protein